jgi:hypothetical protein
MSGRAGFAKSIPVKIDLRWAIIFALVYTVFALHSQAADPGVTTGDLLRVPVSARAIGMGEAYTAMADDSSALAWNPAGLSFMQQREAAFMHSSLFEGIHYERLAYAVPGDRLSFGTSLTYLGFGDIEGYDNAGASIGTQSAYSYALTGGLSTLLRERLSLGLTASFLQQKLADESASTFALNSGVLYEFASRPLGGAYRVGFSALNLGPGLKFVEERDPLPRKYNFGASVMHLKELPLNLSADVTIPNDNSPAFGIGSEYWLKNTFALRFGYAGTKDEGSGLRFGFGLRVRDLLFDYAFSDQGDLGSAHRVEVMFRWGERMHPMNREQRAMLKEARKGKGKDDHIVEIMALNDILNSDPMNDEVLKRMIVAHERLLKNELQEAVAQAPTPEEVPSPEEFALQDLVPGQQSIAQAPHAFDPSDPLGLENLPDISEPDTLSPAPSAPIAVVPAPSAVPSIESALREPAPEEAATEMVPESDGILLKPSDIYN